MIHHSLRLRLRRSLRAAAALVAVAAVTSSCDSTIYDYEGDCSVTYRMKFRYDHNMKYADAFAHEVKSVTLYAFNAADGSLAYTKTESGDALAADGYTMTLDGLAPGDYDFVAWGGTEGHDAYILPSLTSRASSRTDAICSLNVKQGSDGGKYIDRELNPGLFHGRIAETQTLPDLGEKVMEMPMVKNTNRLTVVLQQLSGDPVKASDFEFRVTGAHNAVMGHDNTIISDDEVTYHAWHTRDGVADIETSGGVSSLGAAVADISLGRLMTADKPRLVITRASDGQTVLSIPLIDYFLLVKGHYNDGMSDQEYLDRQDEYNMTFFLDENNRWLNSVIYINSWRVVLDNIDFQ